METNDLLSIGSVAKADEQAFEKLFADWYGPLHAYANSVMKDEAMADEVVQSVFCRLWEKRKQLRAAHSVRAYLYGSVYHECVSWMRREKVRRQHRPGLLRWFRDGAKGSSGGAADRVEAGDLERRFQRALDELPPQCRAIFELSRFGELKYREIAGQLGISVKTVEAQMGKALKLLRDRLTDFL